MANKFDQVLDSINTIAVGVNRATRRRRKWRREHVVIACQVGSAILSAVSTFVPAVRPFAATLNGLQTAIPAEASPPLQQQQTRDSDQRLMARLQMVHRQLQQVPSDNGFTKAKLEGQQELLLDLFEDKEHDR